MGGSPRTSGIYPFPFPGCHLAPELESKPLGQLILVQQQLILGTALFTVMYDVARGDWSED